jgi:hypothetical protein
MSRGLHNKGANHEARHCLLQQQATCTAMHGLPQTNVCVTTHLPEELQAAHAVIVLVGPVHCQCVEDQCVVQVDGKAHQRITGQRRQIHLQARKTVRVWLRTAMLQRSLL